MAAGGVRDPATLTIDIVSDLVCPWCFIGKRRLDAALAQIRQQQPDFAYRTVWHPYFLNPDTPSEGEPYLPFLERKFGSRAAVDALFARVQAAAADDGIKFAFEKIRSRANTLQAHRLIHWAQARGTADDLMDRLFVAQFQRGQAIGDSAVLAAIATESGYSGEAVLNYLASADDVETILVDERRARAAGISGVPTFILDGSHILVGAQSVVALVHEIRNSVAD